MQKDLHSASPFISAHKLLAKVVPGYWLDSGTLLGIVRDGQAISGDSDFDVGIWEEEVPALLKALPEFRKIGYRTSTRRYRGRLYGATIAYPDRSHLPIHVHVYFRSGDIAWSPQTVSYKPVARENGLVGFCDWPALRKFMLRLKSGAKSRNSGPLLKRLIKRSVCFPAWGAFVMVRNRLDREVWAEWKPFSALYSMYTWMVPLRFFDDLDSVELDGTQLPVPSRSEEYLSLRYGNWKVPVSDWCYWTDDGLIVPSPPERALEGYA